jgi:hypothetical protein
MYAVMSIIKGIYRFSLGSAFKTAVLMLIDKVLNEFKKSINHRLIGQIYSFLTNYIGQFCKVDLDTKKLIIWY